jgi:hypothetical protein
MQDLLCENKNITQTKRVGQNLGAPFELIRKIFDDCRLSQADIFFDLSDRHQPIQSVSAIGTGSHKDRVHYVPPDKADPFLAISR